MSTTTTSRGDGQAAPCAATTKRGARCANRAKAGETLCAVHLGLAHRPTKLTEELTARIAALLRNGNYIATACGVAGIHPDSYFAWRERGEADIEAGVRSAFAEFAEATTRARAEGRALLLQEIRSASRGTERRPGDWRAAAWILERSWPEEYGPRREVRIGAGELPRRQESVEIPEDDDRLLTVAQLLAEIGVLPELDQECEGDG